MFHVHPTLRVIPLRRAGGPASTEPRAEHSVALGVIDVATTRPDRAKAFNAPPGRSLCHKQETTDTCRHPECRTDHASSRYAKPESLPTSDEYNMQMYEKFPNNSIKHPDFQRPSLSLKKENYLSRSLRYWEILLFLHSQTASQKPRSGVKRGGM